MRPEANTADGEEYECVDCGERTTAPEGRVCDGCGGTLRNLSVERDL
jgi:rRNA maturation endonuclease Nob1